jgi:hypothetical protein
MTTITITELPSLGTILDSTLIPTETSNVTKHIRALDLKNYVSDALANVNGNVAVFQTLSTSGNIDTTGNIHVFDGNIYASNVVSYSNFYGDVIGNAATATKLRSARQINGVLFDGTTSINIGAEAGLLTGNTLSSNVTNSTLTSVGTLVGLTVSDTILPAANASIDIGSSSSWFGTFYGISAQAKYADLAEKYTSDQKYPPGTVMVFGKETEVTISTQANDKRVAGVVTTNPAYLMNSEIDGVGVALQGRVNCFVKGTVVRGDMLVTSDIPGVAMTNNEPSAGTIIGKALGNYNNEQVGVIEVVVGRL